MTGRFPFRITGRGPQPWIIMPSAASSTSPIFTLSGSDSLASDGRQGASSDHLNSVCKPEAGYGAAPRLLKQSESCLLRKADMSNEIRL